MSADVIILPVIRRDAARNAFEDVALPEIHIPRRVHLRLSRLAKAWGIEPNAAAESLLIDAINCAAGVKR